MSPLPVYLPTAWALPKLVITGISGLRNPVSDLVFWDRPDSCVALGATRNRDIDFKPEVKSLRQTSEFFSFRCSLNQEGVHSLHRGLLVELEVAGQQKAALSFCDLNQLLIVEGAGIFDVLAKHAKPSGKLPKHAVGYELQFPPPNIAVEPNLYHFPSFLKFVMKAVITNLLLISHGYSVLREERLKIGITDELIRLALGIEDPEGSIADQDKPLTRSIKEKFLWQEVFRRRFTARMVLAREKPYVRASKEH